MSRQKTTVQIGGMDFPIAGNETEAYIREVAAYVDTTLAKIMQGNQSIGMQNAAILTAVNLADELFKTRQAVNELRGQMEQSIAKEAEIRGQLQQQKAEIERLQDEVRRGQNEARRLKGNRA